MHTKEKILAESMELFAVNGYEGTSMAKIAEKVGIKKPSLYAHYKSKEALFIDINKKMADEYVDFVKASLVLDIDNVETLLFESMKIHLQDLARMIRAFSFIIVLFSILPKDSKSSLLRVLRKVISKHERSWKRSFLADKLPMQSLKSLMLRASLIRTFI
ncbi:helix-turn-helix domain-containing protein [Bacillus sp. JCM 19041]|uniref:TetR/AcrR family transcriptional regulator n=1 Tax=Bacillus sp. JCM 19041 TaxID=1460637 RepID=UPI000ABFA1CB